MPTIQAAPAVVWATSAFPGNLREYVETMHSYHWGLISLARRTGYGPLLQRLFLTISNPWPAYRLSQGLREAIAQRMTPTWEEAEDRSFLQAVDGGSEEFDIPPESPGDLGPSIRRILAEYTDRNITPTLLEEVRNLTGNPVTVTADERGNLGVVFPLTPVLPVNRIEVDFVVPAGESGNPVILSRPRGILRESEVNAYHEYRRQQQLAVNNLPEIFQVGELSPDGPLARSPWGPNRGGDAFPERPGHGIPRPLEIHPLDWERMMEGVAAGENPPAVILAPLLGSYPGPGSRRRIRLAVERLGRTCRGTPTAPYPAPEPESAEITPGNVCSFWSAEIGRLNRREPVIADLSEYLLMTVNPTSFGTAEARLTMRGVPDESVRPGNDCRLPDGSSGYITEVSVDLSNRYDPQTTVMVRYTPLLLYAGSLPGVLRTPLHNGSGANYVEDIPW